MPELPRVTEILRKIGIAKRYDGIDPIYAEIGTASALAIKLDIEGQLDESSLDDLVKPRLDAFRKFRQETGYSPRYCELSLVSDKHGYRGTLDHLGVLNGKCVLLDTKCSQVVQPETDLQLMGYYWLLWEQDYGSVQKRGALRLGRDGEWELVWYDTDPMVWFAVLEIYRWKTKRGDHGFTQGAYATSVT